MSVKILLAGKYDDWHDLAPSRWNQPLQNRLAEDLKLVGSRIQNGVTEGTIGGLHFRLEVEERKHDGEEAA